MGISQKLLLLTPEKLSESSIQLDVGPIVVIYRVSQKKVPTFENS